jgi:hypothetical protein
MRPTNSTAISFVQAILVSQLRPLHRQLLQMMWADNATGLTPRASEAKLTELLSMLSEMHSSVARQLASNRALPAPSLAFPMTTTHGRTTKNTGPTRAKRVSFA